MKIYSRALLLLAVSFMSGTTGCAPGADVARLAFQDGNQVRFAVVAGDEHEWNALDPQRRIEDLGSKHLRGLQVSPFHSRIATMSTHPGNTSSIPVHLYIRITDHRGDDFRIWNDRAIKDMLRNYFSDADLPSVTNNDMARSWTLNPCTNMPIWWVSSHVIRVNISPTDYLGGSQPLDQTLLIDVVNNKVTHVESGSCRIDPTNHVDPLLITKVNGSIYINDMIVQNLPSNVGLYSAVK